MVDVTVVIVGALVALPPTLATILSDRRAQRERQDMREEHARTRAESVTAREATSTKLDHITVLTNSTLTTANRRIEELELIVLDLRKTVKILEARVP